MVSPYLKIVEKAIAADNEDDYEKAFELYGEAIYFFGTGLKYEKDKERKNFVLGPMEDYI